MTHKTLVSAVCVAFLSVNVQASTPATGIGTAVSAYSGAVTSATEGGGSGLTPGLAGAGSAAISGPLSPGRIASGLAALQPEGPSSSRGALEVGIYRQFSHSVVLVLTQEGLGSGALISPDGTIVTNYHVVGSAPVVGVIFKPSQEGSQITERDLVRARVIKIDQVADLAIIKVDVVPPATQALSLGNIDSVMVGEDVHAIGHPTGEAWTYTRGIVSQIRRNYQWTAETNLAHSATVIQTQTPINPGNSGGPLLDNDGRLIGINSFKSEGEGLNFAVSVDEVQRVLRQSSNRYAAVAKPTKQSNAAQQCEPREGRKQRVQDPAGVGIPMDLDCNDTFESEVIIPDDKSKPIQLLMDSDGDGKVDTVLLDTDRDGKVDGSVYDTNHDGKPDLIGYYKDGSDDPYRYEKVE